MPSALLNLPGYSSLVRRDRCGRRGGGVLVLARDDVHYTRRSDLEYWDECIWIEMLPNYPHGRRILLGCFYRPPSSDIDDFCSALESSFSQIDLLRSDVFLLGDFNATSPSWLPSDTLNRAGSLLEPLFLQLSLQQLVSSATHFLPSRPGCGSLLDLVLASRPDLVSSTSILPPLGSSDHAVIHCQLQFSPATRRGKSRLTRIWAFEKADLSKLNNALFSSDWSTVASATSVDDAWCAWKTIFLDVINKFIPSKLVGRVKRKQPWISPALEKVIREKHRTFRRFKRCPSADSRAEFVRLRNRVTKLTRKAEKSYIETLHRSARLTNSSAAVKRFWQCVRTVTGRSHVSHIPDLLSPSDGSLVSTDKEKANLLNRFFASQTLLEDRDKPIPPITSSPDGAEFSHMSTTPASVYDALCALKLGKAPGKDGFTPQLLQVCARGIASSLACLFNRSFEEGVVPSEWKEAVVTPVFKKGDRTVPTNYRPISLLPIIGKVQERLVFDKLYPFLSSVLSSRQSGFRKGDGTSMQLFRLVQTWSSAIDSSAYVATVFFDLRRAFDRVWHRGLLAKLAANGVSGSALSWFRNYLSHRKQQVSVGRELSVSADLHAGVPQGAILSPLLFITYINDITSSTTEDINLFADDTSLAVSDKDPSRLEHRLQLAIDAVASWFTRWLLTANSDKTSLMVFRSRRMSSVSLSPKLNDDAILQVKSHRHLGLVFNEHLGWHDHVSHITRKASQRLGLLTRLRRRLPPLVIRQLYLSCIRPSLEYASLVWCGLTAGDQAQLDRVQRRAARLITGILPRSDTPHAVLLARAGLEDLSSRGKLAQATFAYRMVHDNLPEHLQTYLNSVRLHRSALSRSLRNSNSVHLPRARKSVLLSSPLYVCSSTWNSLSLSLLLFSSLFPSLHSSRPYLSSSLGIIFFLLSAFTGLDLHVFQLLRSPLLLVVFPPSHPSY